MPRSDMTKLSVALPAVLIFFLIAGPCFAEADNPEFRVRRAGFKGVKAVDQKQLSATLVVNPPPFWKFWEGHPVVSLQDVEEDRLRIQKYYEDQGYYQADVTHTVTTVNRSEIDVEFQITEGPPVIVKTLSLNRPEKDFPFIEEQLKAEIPLKTGAVFKRAQYEQSKTLLKTRLGNQGYPFAKVRGQARVDLNANLADVAFDLDPGHFYLFGQVRFSGHEGYVREKVLKRAVTFSAGQEFEERKLEESRRNLFDLGVFQTAQITTEPPDEESRTVPIFVQVKARKQHSVELGAGYGTEDRLRLRGAWTYRNLTRNADRVSFSAMRSELKENIEGRYVLPYFLSSKNRFTAVSGYEREKSDYYIIYNLFTRATVSRRFARHWLASAGYNLEVNRPQHIRYDEAVKELDSINDKDYRISSASISFEHNTVADVLNPQKGSVISFSCENACGGLGSEIDYIKPTLEGKNYLPLPRGLVLAGRAGFQTIKPIESTDEIPIYRQLFLGGSKTVRGYAYQEFGVINHHGVPVDVSGLSSFSGNIELRYPIYREISGVVFLDMGVLDDDYFRYDFSNMRYTTGLGLRYDTVIGPIQLDFGYKLNPPKRVEGLAPDLEDIAKADRWRLHVSIGQAF